MSRLFSLVALSLIACGPSTVAPLSSGDASSSARCGTDADGNRTFAVLHFNDSSRIAGLLDGRGGLARIRQLRKELEAECGGNVLLTVGGDVLFPSLLSRTYGGVPMVDALNRLDGDQDEPDSFMFSVFGNADFTRSSMKDSPHFAATLKQSQFTWLHSNIRWIPSAGIDGEMLAERKVIDLHGVKVGLFGLTTDQKKPAYGLVESDYGVISNRETAELGKEGAEVVIALTHLDHEEDKALLSGAAGEGPDLVLGGQPERGESLEVDGRWILKGQADATAARVAWVTLKTDGSIGVQHELVKMGPESPVEDASLSMAVDAWWSAFDAVFCGEEVGCLEEPYSHTKTLLHGSEPALRGAESALGNWTSDILMGAFENTDAALVNAGALRIGQDLPAYTVLGRRVVEELVQFENELVVVEMSGERVEKMLSHAVSSWPSSHFLQVAGLAFRHDVSASEATDVHMLTDQGPVPLSAKENYRIVMPRFLVDPTRGDQDGYGEESAGGLSMTDVAESDLSMRAALIAALQEAGKAGIAPEREGRICRQDLPDRPCLVPASSAE